MEDAVTAAERATNRAAINYAAALSALLANDTPETIAAYRAADHAFGDARAKEALAKADALLELLRSA